MRWDKVYIIFLYIITVMNAIDDTSSWKRVYSNATGRVNAYLVCVLFRRA